jgi:hypothetical protein
VSVRGTDVITSTPRRHELRSALVPPAASGL